MSQKEHDIHEIVKYYPYLLGSEFENLNLKHEKIYADRTRADFVFAGSDVAVVVEVKKGQVDAKMLDQALHYLENERKENPRKKLRGVLIGSHISNALRNEIEKSGYVFEIMILDIDVPTKVKICDNCRRANALSNPICKYCRSSKFIIDPFLFQR